MNDLLRDLRDMFDEQAGHAGWAPGVAPAPLLRRVRRRQVGVVVASVATAVAVVAGFVLGTNALLHRNPAPATPHGVPHSIRDVTVTAPRDWGFTPLDDAFGSGSADGDRTLWPAFSLHSSFDGRPSTTCRVAEIPMSPLGVTLAVFEDLEVSPALAGGVRPWPQADLVPGNGFCGPGRYARWSVGGTLYEAFAFVGSDASDAERRSLTDAFRSMTFGEGGRAVAEGSAAGTEWTLWLYPGPGEFSLELRWAGGRAAAAGGNAPELDYNEHRFVATDGFGYARMIFGRAPKGTAGVMARTPGDTREFGEEVQGTVVAVPDSVDDLADAFVVVTGGGPVELTAVDADGNVLDRSTPPADTPAAATAAVTPREGRSYSVVYLTTGPADGSEPARADHLLSRWGVPHVTGPVSCDEGAPPGPRGPVAVGVYFEDPNAADGFAGFFAPMRLGRGVVTRTCPA